MHVLWESSCAYIMEAKLGLKQFTDFLTKCN